MFNSRKPNPGPAPSIEQDAALLRLPDELLAKTFSFFNQRELARVSEVCITLRRVSRDASVIEQAEPVLDYSQIQAEKTQQLNLKNSALRFALELTPGNIVGAFSDGEISLWDYSKSKIKLIHAFRKPGVAVTALAKLSNTTFASAEDGVISIWDAHETISLRELSLPANTNIFLLKLPGDYILSGGSDGMLRIWNYQTGECIQVIYTYSIPICASLLANDQVAYGCMNGRVTIFNYVTRQDVRSFKVTDMQIGCIYTLLDGKHIVIGTDNEYMHSWNADNGEKVTCFKQKSVRAVQQLTENLIVSVSRNGDQQIWNLHTQKSIATLRETNLPMYVVMKLSDGAILTSDLGCQLHVYAFDLHKKSLRAEPSWSDGCRIL